MNRDEEKRNKTHEIKATSNLNFNIASLCSEKPLYKYATKKYKCSDEVALYEGNSVKSAAIEGM